MTAKEYFSRIYRLDQSIRSKQLQISSLKSIAMGCGHQITGMPKNPSPPASTMADAVCGIVDAKDALESELAELLQLRLKCMDVIHRVHKPEYQILLENRYLNHRAWEDIAADMNCTVSWVFKMHRKALKAADSILREMEAAHELP